MQIVRCIPVKWRGALPKQKFHLPISILEPNLAPPEPKPALRAACKINGAHLVADEGEQFRSRVGSTCRASRRGSLAFSICGLGSEGRLSQKLIFSRGFFSV